MRTESARWGWVLLLPLLVSCSKLTFIRQDVIGKGKIEQERAPVVARDSAEVKRRMAAQDHVMRASSALQAGEIDNAEREARAALADDPGSADAMTLLGAVAGQRGQVDAAGEWLTRAMQASGGGGAEAGNYGAWLCGKGEAEKSLPYFDYAIERLGDDFSRADSLANAGTCAMQAGLGERVQAYLRRALQLDGQNRLALESMAALAYRQGQYFEARAFIERRMALPAVNASTLRLGAEVEQHLGDARAAARYRERLQRDFPSTTPPASGN